MKNALEVARVVDQKRKRWSPRVSHGAVSSKIVVPNSSPGVRLHSPTTTGLWSSTVRHTKKAKCCPESTELGRYRSFTVELRY
jgi:hypothetical protein